MNWESPDHSFCESKILGLPEYINSITSLFISGFGLLGLFNTVKSNMYVDIIYALLIIIGFGSVGYHWTGNIGWAMFDEMPMIFSIFASIIYIDSISAKLLSTINSTTSYPNYTQKCKLLIYLTNMVGFVICNTMTNYRRLFPIFFGLVMLYMYYKVYELYNITSPLMKKITINKMYFAQKTVLISAIIWTTTEVLCTFIAHPIFLIGHPMWHFFIGHGFYNVIQIIYYVDKNNMNYNISYSYLYIIRITEMPANIAN
jgi:hypothetical protein